MSEFSLLPECDQDTNHSHNKKAGDNKADIERGLGPGVGEHEVGVGPHGGDGGGGGAVGAGVARLADAAQHRVTEVVCARTLAGLVTTLAIVTLITPVLAPGINIFILHLIIGAASNCYLFPRYPGRQ